MSLTAGSHGSSAAVGPSPRSVSDVEHRALELGARLASGAGAAEASPAPQPNDTRPAPEPAEHQGDLSPDTPITRAGSLMVRGKILTGASVSARGDLIVEGLVEGATLEVGGDLCAAGGINGVDRCRLSIGRTLEARFMDSVSGEVAHRLRVEREAINCRLLLHGEVDSPSGSIIGGELIVGRRIRIATLGSKSAVPTRLVLGSVPLLEPLLGELDALVEDVVQRRDAIKRELDLLSTPGRRLRPPEKERQTELSFQGHSIESLVSRCLLMQEEYRQRIRRLRTVDVWVGVCAHPGVIFEVDGCGLRLKQALEGPLRVTREAKGALTIRRDDQQGSIPLSRVADVVARRT